MRTAVKAVVSIGGCSECPKRDGCKTPCLAVRDYVDQDHVGMREMTTRNEKVFDSATPDWWSPLQEDSRAGQTMLLYRHLSRREKEVIKAILVGLSVADVSEELSITPDNIYKIRERIKRRAREVLSDPDPKGLTQWRQR